MIEEFEWL